MFTAFTADVRPESEGRQNHFHLRAVALGLGTEVEGKNVIITPETANDHGVELDWITREILTKGYKTQALAKVVVRGPSFALVDTPVWYRCNARHQLLRFRYALLVDTSTGRLDVLTWLLDNAECADGIAVVLDQNTVDEAELIPNPTEFNALGIPSDAAFAVDRLPPHGAQLLLPTDLRHLAAQAKYTLKEAALLESGLRKRPELQR